MLTASERVFFEKQQPLGLILFSRNVNNPEQIRRLIENFKDCVDGPVLILIDQEGGRVARLKIPHWRKAPAMGTFGKMAHDHPTAAASALRLNCRLIANELRDLGINVNCLPVLDMPISEADPIIGDRAFSSDPNLTRALGRIAVDAMLETGVAPVIKHIPGHGRAKVDSHLALPVVDTRLKTLSRTDFVPFAGLADAPLAMTAHIVYSDIDPEQPATFSKIIIGRIIRMKMGFRGLLLTDDLSMKALSGSMAEKAQKALQAGCDIILHCNGDMKEMTAIADVIPVASDLLCEHIENLVQKMDAAPLLDYAHALKAYQKIISDWGGEKIEDSGHEDGGNDNSEDET